MKKHRTERTADQRAQENIILAWFAVIVITAAVFAGLLTQSNINTDAKSQAVHQVQSGSAR